MSNNDWQERLSYFAILMGDLEQLAETDGLLERRAKMYWLKGRLENLVCGMTARMDVLTKEKYPMLFTEIGLFLDGVSRPGDEGKLVAHHICTSSCKNMGEYTNHDITIDELIDL